MVAVIHFVMKLMAFLTCVCPPHELNVFDLQGADDRIRIGSRVDVLFPLPLYCVGIRPWNQNPIFGCGDAF